MKLHKNLKSDAGSSSLERKRTLVRDERNDAEDASLF